MSYIDIAIIALIVLSGLVGLWKGFFKTFIGMFGGIISLVLAVLLSKIVAEACVDGFAHNFVLGDTGSLKMAVGALLPDALRDLEAGATTEQIAAALGTGLFGSFLKPFVGVWSDSIVAMGVTPFEGISVLLSFQIFTVLVAIALFIIIRLLMCLFTMFAKSFLGKKKSGLSRLFGCVLGLARGAVYACVLLLIASFFTGFNFMSGYNTDLEKSTLAKAGTEFVTKIPEKIFSDKDLFSKMLEGAGLLGPSKDENGDSAQTAPKRETSAVGARIKPERLVLKETPQYAIAFSCA